MVLVKEQKDLSVGQLRRICDEKTFKFKSTAEIDSLKKVIGQERAVRATSFGIGIESPGYHMFALGPSGTRNSKKRLQPKISVNFLTEFAVVMIQEKERTAITFIVQRT